MSAEIFAILGTTEQNVMVQLAQQRTTGLVALAADLWRTTHEWAADDLEPLLGYVIDSLCSRGLVSYRLANRYPTKQQVPHDIRLTRLGWEVMGYARYVPEVGSAQRHGQTAKHRRDGTNYLNQPFSARGGPIEVQDFATHRVTYPHHVHDYGDSDMPQTKAKDRADALSDPTILQDPNGTGNRGYLRVTDEIEAKVLAYQTHLGVGASQADIAEAASVPLRTVKYILTDLPRLRRMKFGEVDATKSLKERVYSFIESAHPRVVPDVAEIRRVLGAADDEHSILHVLHSLHTQGRIDFTERGSGMGKATVVDIHLPKRNGGTKSEKDVAIAIATEELGRPPVDATGVSVEVVRPEATAEPEALTAPPSAPGPAEEGYPLLDALLEREGKRLAQDATMMSYVNAAEAIVNIDPEMFDALMAKASQYDIPYPSPIESEFLRYVANHPQKGDSK